MISQKPLSRQLEGIIEQASDWVVRLDREHIEPGELNEFAAWLAKDPRHEIEFQKASMLWSGVPRQATSLCENREEGFLANLARFFSPKRYGLLAGGLAGLLLVVAAVFLMGTPSPLVDSFETAHAERRTITLEDGSEIFMNGASKVSIHYTERLRLVTLDQGEAFFEVAKDRSRPFVVDLKNGAARALGTKFNVRTHNENAAVSVVEGRVEVKRENGLDEGERIIKTVLETGQKIAYGADGNGKTETVDVDQIAPWRYGRITFDNWELEEIIAEVNRYRKVPIIFADPELKQRRLSGSFGIDKTEDFLLALQTLSVAEVVDRGDSIALIMTR